MKWDSGPLTGESLSVTMPAGVLLDTETVYKWRAKVCDSGGSWSEWSEPTSFTTKVSFADPLIVPPVLSSPVDGNTISNLTPTLTTDAFAVANGSDTHEKTQWQLRKSSGSYDVAGAGCGISDRLNDT